MHNNDAPAVSLGLYAQTCKFQIEDQFKFTPVKVIKTVPRVWDRKPSTSFIARPKSRKLWKRFRSSFNSMKALQQMIADEQNEIDELHTEINASKNAGFVRGVKRLCLELKDADSSVDAAKERGRSFLETMWKTEVTRRRRKLPTNDWRAFQNSDDDDSFDSKDLSFDSDVTVSQDDSATDIEVMVDKMEEDHSMNITPHTPPKQIRDTFSLYQLQDDESSDLQNEEAEGDADIGTYGRVSHNAVFIASSQPGNVLQEAIAFADALVKTCGDAMDATTTDDRHLELLDDRGSPTIIAHVQGTSTGTDSADSVQDMTTEQESTLVRSALRCTLVGEDAELLNDFLSKAKAKRAAKAALTLQDADIIAEKPSNDEDMVSEFPTPRSRRALEELDKNSPSPQKPQFSPSKSDEPHDAPVLDDLTDSVSAGEADDQQQPASPACRRSNRASKPPPRVNLPAVRSTISLRRAKGTEFVFLQRTEAQEIALATRRNTRRNKGDAQLPKLVLQALAEQQQESEGAATPDSGSDTLHPKAPRKRAGAKQVSWNEERLIEYEGGERDECCEQSSSDDVAGTEKEKSASNRPEKKKATSASRRNEPRSTVQAQESSDDNASAAQTTAATATPTARRMRRLGPISTSSAALETTTTPITRRRKLTPKSPSTTALLGAPASNAISKPAVKTASSGRGSTTAGIRSKSIIKATAGSTPMPKRVRART